MSDTRLEEELSEDEQKDSPLLVCQRCAVEAATGVSGAVPVQRL